MDNILAVKVLNTEADVYEYFPDQVVNERLHFFASSGLLLSLYHCVQIADWTVLEYYVNFLVI